MAVPPTQGLTVTQNAPHVLVIEDDRDVLDLLDTHLNRLGCRVSRAEDGERGLALAQRDPPDVVIIDVILPGIDGREVVRRLRADQRTNNCKIVVSSILDADDLDDINTDAILAKPFRRATLTQLVHDLTAGRTGEGR
jgi:CheY-like chemotaxis protein